MNITVTGGAGFIGSHLCEHLLAQGHALSIIDDLNAFYSPEAKQENLSLIRKRGGFEFHACDIRDITRVAAIIKAFQPRVVIHLAARAGVRPSLLDPFLYEEVNIRGTLGLLEASRNAGVRKVIFASSSSVYGVCNVPPFSEDTASIWPASPYAATKIAGEKLCYTYSHLYGISIVCLRFFTVYGPRQRPDLAIHKFSDLISRGDPIPVFGDGSTGRDYTFIDDVISGILAAVSYECNYEVFNIGNSRPVMLSELIRAIEQVVGRSAIIERCPDQPGDVPITYASIEKAKRLLGYAPHTDLQRGLTLFWSWYRQVGRHRG
jgi:UDP-glucuronate 4-epimerase